MLRYESAGIVYGLTVDGLGQVEVQVPSTLAEEARQVLAPQERENTKLPGQAPNREP